MPAVICRATLRNRHPPMLAARGALHDPCAGVARPARASCCRRRLPTSRRSVPRASGNGPAR
eukprot:767374-Lingulodinium_polyedra.AAC.1